MDKLRGQDRIAQGSELQAIISTSMIMNTVMETIGEADKTLRSSIETAKKIFVVGLVFARLVSVGVTVDLCR